METEGSFVRQEVPKTWALTLRTVEQQRETWLITNVAGGGRKGRDGEEHV